MLGGIPLNCSVASRPAGMDGLQNLSMKAMLANLMQTSPCSHLVRLDLAFFTDLVQSVDKIRSGKLLVRHRVCLQDASA